MVLFRVGSHIQLISAILVRMRIVEEEADIHLIDITDFSQLVEPLKKTGLFRKVIISHDVGITDDLYNHMTRDKRLSIIEKCPDFWQIELDCEYSAYYIGHDTFLNKMFYYHMLKHQAPPEIYLLEDGLDSYSHDVYAYADADDINHEKHKTNSFLNHICGQFLFHPQLYGLKRRHEIFPFPEIDDNVKQTLKSVYGTVEKISQKYIVFTSCFPENRITTNEFELVQRFADLVGKENIAIKCHPRAVHNPYTIRGYYVLPSSSLPWEVYLFDNQMNDKVLVSACSYSVFTAYGMFKNPIPVIFLYKLLKGNFKLVSQKNFIQFIEALTQEYNRVVPQVFSPNSWDSIPQILKYIKGRGLFNESNQ